MTPTPSSSGSPAMPTTASLQDQLLAARAVEATIWGMPAVSMAATRLAMQRDLAADYGDIVYFSNVLEPRHECLTANNQTPYVFAIFDLRRGPMVFEAPPASEKVALFGSAIDSWEVPLVDVGPTGEDAGKGRRYLFLPPDFTSPPPEGFIVVPSPTYYVHIALRPITSDAGTLADAVAYGQQLRAYALADAEQPPENRYIDAYPLAWKTLPVFDMSFLALLAQTIEDEPWQAKDAAMAGLLASIGIAKGTPFAPDAARAAIFTQAVQDGAAAMEDYFIHDAQAPFWPDRQWLTIKTSGTYGFSFYGDGVLDYDRRAGGFACWATWAPKKLSDPDTLPASYYLQCFTDATGQRFRGMPPASASGGCAVSHAGSGRHPGARLLVDHRLRGRHERLHPQPPEPGGRLLL